MTIPSVEECREALKQLTAISFSFPISREVCFDTAFSLLQSRISGELVEPMSRKEMRELLEKPNVLISHAEKAEGVPSGADNDGNPVIYGLSGGKTEVSCEHKWTHINVDNPDVCLKCGIIQGREPKTEVPSGFPPIQSLADNYDPDDFDFSNREIVEMLNDLRSKCLTALSKHKPVVGVEWLKELILESSLCHTSMSNRGECEKEVEELALAIAERLSGGGQP